jgi:hypothetical protein
LRIGLSQFLDFLLLAGEAAWIYAWAITVGAWSGNGTVVDLQSLILLLLVPIMVSRLAISRRWPGPVMRGLVVLLGLAAVALAAMVGLTPPLAWSQNLADWGRWLDAQNTGRAALAGALAATAWQRGLAQGRSRPDTAWVESSFRTGTIAICSLLAVVGLGGDAIHISSDALIPSTLVLLIAGLIGMPLARIGDVRNRPRHRHGAALAPGGPWLAMLLAVVAGILAVTLILARLFTFERIGTLFDAVTGRLDAALSAIVYVLAVPFALLVEALIYLIRLIQRPVPQRPSPEQQGLDWMSRLGSQAAPESITPEELFVLKAAVALVLAALLAWVLWRAISRIQRFWGHEDVDEDRESVWVWPGWRAVGRWLLARTRPIKARVTSVVVGQHGAVAEERSVRGVYRGLLRLGAGIGHPRYLAETPIEYGERLRKAIVEGSAEVRIVSDAYVHVRYGPPSPAAPDLNHVASALERLRALPKALVPDGSRHQS